MPIKPENTAITAEHTEHKPKTVTETLLLSPEDHGRLARLCGACNDNLRLIETYLSVSITYQGCRFTIEGGEKACTQASAIIRHLYRETESDTEINPELIQLYVREAGLDELDKHSRNADTQIKTPKLHIRPRSGNQSDYVKSIKTHDINFGIGPAGTGKTYLAVACAVEALNNETVERILLVRPAVEAGEKLGFLPGDLAQKVDPYLRPLYDALYEMVGVENVSKMIDRNIIEIAPLAFMRGRTLNRAFIILDESQNTTREQMKMFLTRIGFGSTAVITGDITQIDLAKGQASGLTHVSSVLSGVPGISFTRFTSKDVVRHPLVQRIVEAYDRHENNTPDS